jgi:hypothetical protein
LVCVDIVVLDRSTGLRKGRSRSLQRKVEEIVAAEKKRNAMQVQCCACGAILVKVEMTGPSITASRAYRR